MALDLTDKNPFPTTSLSLSTIDRPGFTFDPDFQTTDFQDWKDDFEKNLDNLELDLNEAPASIGFPLSSSSSTGTRRSPSGVAGIAGSTNSLDDMGNLFLAMQGKGEKNLALGYGLKTAAAAGELFTRLATIGDAWGNANRRATNTKQNVANQMLALDNQVQYYKNQITDKFARTMARNTVTMAAKNLRVTASNLLEQTKDAAYDATKDIQTLESNTELKKIALRSEARQAEVAKKLSKNLMVADLVGSLAKVGLMVSGGIEAGVDYGKLFTSDTTTMDENMWSLNDVAYGDKSGSLNDVVYGRK